MAAPTVVAVGAVASGTGAITPAFPAGLVADDIMIGIGESNGNAAYTVPTGWAHVLGSPINVDTSTRLTVIWRRFQAGDTALSWGDSGNHNVGRIIGVRGVKATGDPWNVSPVSSQETLLNTSAEWPSVTTTAVDCLVLLCIATGRDAASTANLGTVTNAALTSITERMDNWVSSGAGGGIGMVTAVKASAGAVGTSTASLVSTDAKALLTIALEPASGDVTVTPAVIACTTTLPRPAVNVTSPPASIVATAALPQPQASIIAGPAVVPAPVAVARPLVDVVAAPNAVPLLAVLPQAAGGVHATPLPAALAVVTVLPQAAPSVAVGPAVVALTATLPQPSIAVQASPAMLAALMALPQATPMVEGSVIATPGAVATVVALVRPAVNTSAGPALVAAVAILPTASAGVAAGPAVLPVLIVMPLATAGGAGASTPGAMTVIAAVAPQPTMTVTAPAQPSMHGRQTQTAGMTGSGD